MAGDDQRDDDENDADLSSRISQSSFIKLWDPRQPLARVGRFEGLQNLGAGGFGVVYKVRDPDLDREVALKLCKTTSEEAKRGILREARLLAQLSHPNIITVHEVGEHEDAVFIVMELVEGLDGRKFARARPSWEDAVDFYRQAGRGLAAAHAKGIVHGDFKPHNVLRGPGGEARVLDFGLARVMRDRVVPPELPPTQAGRRGTLPYMAPEVLRGQLGDPRADQWSFCVSLWQTLAGERPFDGATEFALLEAIEDGPSHAEAAEDVPPRLWATLVEGLAIDPADRFESMDALVDELDAIRSGSAGGGFRPPGGIVVFSAMVLLSGLLAGLVVAMILGIPKPAGPGQEGSSPAPTLEVPLDPEVEAVERAKAEVLELIERRSFDLADRKWEQHQADLDNTLCAFASLTVGRAFLDQALRLEDEHNYYTAITAAEKARKWSIRARQVDELAGDSDAAAAALNLHDDSRALADALRSKIP